ncbi:glycosyltransferase [Ureibacillus chungkukjangi]|uniref:glycosyltransferase n=1 Tax=Ureibacillus chungkukjangi TaxID=1202712 RepID=UPI0011B4900F|nr:glycosyltransferase [Ureibacillus chungkukjangi]
MKNQSEIDEVAMLNCSNIQLQIPEDEINYKVFTNKDCPDGNLTKLPKPFNRPDIVIFHGVYYIYYCKVFKYLIKNSIPYVIVPHSSLTSFAQRKKRMKKLIGNYILFNKFIKNANAIQYLTIEEQRMSSTWKKGSFVCGNGMTLLSNSLKKVFPEKDDFHLVFVSRLDPYQKGLDILLEACNSISNLMREKNISLTIYGPDDCGGEKIVKDLVVNYQIDDLVTIAGPVYGAEKHKILTEADVFVLTSRFEGQPLAVMEALAIGLPVLLTPGTNIADDVVENNCGWKAELSVDSIAEKIIEAYNSRHLLTQLSTNAINYSKTTFSWDIIAQKTIGHYKELIEK